MSHVCAECGDPVLWSPYLSLCEKCYVRAVRWAARMSAIEDARPRCDCTGSVTCDRATRTCQKCGKFVQPLVSSVESEFVKPSPGLMTFDDFVKQHKVQVVVSEQVPAGSFFICSEDEYRAIQACAFETAAQLCEGRAEDLRQCHGYSRLEPDALRKAAYKIRELKKETGHGP